MLAYITRRLLLAVPLILGIVTATFFLKIFPSQRIGIRLAGNLYNTILSTGSGFWCGTGGCGVGLSGWGVWQGDVQAGLPFAF